MLQYFPVVLSIAAVDPPGSLDFLAFNCPLTGVLKEVHFWTTGAANTSGDNVFNINKNGSDLYSGGSRPKIPQSSTHGSITGLSDAVTLGDIFIPQLESKATGGINANLVLLLIIEDGTSSIPSSYLDTDGTLAANSDSKVASQKATKTYVDALIAASDAMVFKGVIDCSTNPNYPAADRGHMYRVSVAGKIGGSSGINVEVGDMLICLTDSTSSGNQATVGSAWSIIQTNLDGAVIGPASATDNAIVRFDATTGKIIQNSAATIDDSGNIAATNLSGTNTGNETTTSEGALINGATSKTTPVDADYIGLMDSAASNVLKKLSWANLKATLKTYLDTLYIAIGSAISATALYGRAIQNVVITTTTYADLFPGSSLNAGYSTGIGTGPTGSVSVSGGKMTIVAGGSGTIVSWGTEYPFLEGQYITFKFDTVSLGGGSIYMGMMKQGGSFSSGSDWFAILLSSTSIYGWSKIGGSSNFNGITYNSGTMIYVRIRRVAATVVFEYNTTNTSTGWTTITTQPFTYTVGTQFHPWYEASNSSTSTAKISDVSSNLGIDTNQPRKSVLLWDWVQQLYVPVQVDELLHQNSDLAVVPTGVAGTGAGTSPTVVIAGCDIAHSVTITPGSSPAGSGATILTVTLKKSYGLTPRVIFSPANGNAAALSGVTAIWMDGASQTTYSIIAGSSALTASSIYKWNVVVLN